MTLLPLALAIGLCLGFTLAVFFVREQLSVRSVRAAKPTRGPASQA